MPEKVRVVSYLVGASLATAALIYIIGPDHVLPSTSPVGLSNRANDCFINSVLQALAGLPELREFLVRETHRRTIDPGLYGRKDGDEGEEGDGGEEEEEEEEEEEGDDDEEEIKEEDEEDDDNDEGTDHKDKHELRMPDWKLRGLQDGLVTCGLKAMLDALNEKARAPKSIAPTTFIDLLQRAFRQHVSRQQQDAHEFLQIIAERLKEEYVAGRAARLRHARRGRKGRNRTGRHDNSIGNGGADEADKNHDDDSDDDGSHCFPMQGRIESHVECRTCGYRTKPREEDFYILTLNVPHQTASTTLDHCLQQQFCREVIDDYRCDKCRLMHLRARLALEQEQKQKQQSSSSSSSVQSNAAAVELAQLDAAIAHDPELLPNGTPLTRGQGWDDVPKRSIVRSSRMSRRPRVLVVHLSRSIFAGASQKNAARVAFPDRLNLGSLVQPCWYRLLAVVMHRGSHNSGHYDSFRRQTVAAAPYPNRTTFRPSSVYSRPASRVPSPRRPSRDSSSTAWASSNHGKSTSEESRPSTEQRGVLSPPCSSPYLSSSCPYSSSGPLAAVHHHHHHQHHHSSSSFLLSSPSPSSSTPSSSSSFSDSSSEQTQATPSQSSKSPPPPPPPQQQQQQQQQQRPLKTKTRKHATVSDKWWRISDEKVKEARTCDVLRMQREAYMLFYEREKTTTDVAEHNTTTATAAATAATMPSLSRSTATQNQTR